MLNPVAGTSGTKDQLSKVDGHNQIDVENLQFLVDVVPVGALLVNQEGRIVLINQELHTALQFTKEELIGEALDVLLPERFRGGHLGLMQDYMKNPVKRSMGQGRSLYARRKNGSEIPIEIGLNPIQSEQGMYILATLSDITSRQQADRMFRQVVENAPYGVLLLNNTGEITLVNPQLCTMFGYTPNELLNSKLEMLLPERYRDHHVSLRDHFVEKPEIRLMGPGRDLTGLHKDGTEFPVEVGLSPLEMNGEHMVMAALSDITIRKKLELDLRQTNANLEEFTYVASHDLRSPLRGISDLLEWIKEDIGENPTPSLAKNLDRIILRIQRMEQLIDNLLTYARAGRSSTELSNVNLTKMLDGITELLQIPQGFEIKKNLGAFHLQTSQTPLETVLRNLISNAIKHHDQEKGCIVIASQAENNMCHISIMDDGPGIPEQSQERIFRLFQTLTSSERAGTGIGLAVARRLVEVHGGKITVESNTNQRGVTFHIWWPRFARRDINDSTTD